MATCATFILGSKPACKLQVRHTQEKKHIKKVTVADDAATVGFVS
jgi:hypothetical protein